MKAVFVLALALISAAQAQSFDPRAHKTFAGPPSQVLVLGTPHIAELPASIPNSAFAPLIDRLAAWKPEVITIEAPSGVQCEELRRYAQLHPGGADYCVDTTPANKATGLDVNQATLAADKLLADWPSDPSAAQRRHLAALFLAGGERASALVQWLRLPASERHPGDGLDDELVKLLDSLRERRNENYIIAAALAARLGHERVYATDDHTADDQSGDKPAYVEAMKRIWNSPASAARKAAHDAQIADAAKPGGLLELYRVVNGPGEAQNAFDNDFGAALRDNGAGLFGRSYVSWWETRNLRMVANIRAVLTPRPGARLLTIVGSSHKGYFEAYLGMMHDVRLVDAQRLLR